ncbi:hypothetical protein P8452_45013 [Trifolium repens]|nr:hypothetical protein P8452_45013 [Trifolium repens]
MIILTYSLLLSRANTSPLINSSLIAACRRCLINQVNMDDLQRQQNLMLYQILLQSFLEMIDLCFTILTIVSHSSILHEVLLKAPEPVLEDCLDERWKLFKNCLGALDGTHIQVNVPAIDKPRYRSASDSRVLRDAISRTNGLKVPTGYYYLVDAGETINPKKCFMGAEAYNDEK